ncbi:PHD/YefM family antitoxin component YafN of YafNO toxin-antitoxin module [Weissella uvarum]|uniref:hypothetical protein n=1 Tax=Weissella uvarum TaxID=1479233 RepID=UPI00195FB219|nr:hypothetical protein [Weissella uvarum]MBM7617916.1 PHD/YefM family antitoxin component YafN of YafNO toxin-antitoxin module [Weissella uvarum]MCM0596087.1 hypothetical protein [Weissella uvarum]
MEVFTSSWTRSNWAKVLNMVKASKLPMQVGTDDAESVVMVPKAEYTSMVETLFLEENGVLNNVFERMANTSETDFDEV